jgi:predicted ATP-grasp superfamily ATP-dependent carboligase
MAVIRALGRAGIPVVAFYYSPNEVGYLSRYVSERVRVPDPRRSEQEFIAALQDLAGRFGGGNLLIPTDDYTLVTLSKNKGPLSAHYTVAAGEWDLIGKVVEKAYVYRLARAIGVPSPETIEPSTVEDLRNLSVHLKYPCLVKPREGHRFYDLFQEKMFQVHSWRDLMEKGQVLQDAGLAFMVQELIPGDDAQGANYNCYMVDGTPVAEFTAQKVRIDPPFFGSPRVLISRRIPELVEPGRSLLRHLGYSGFACIEFKRDARDGVFKLMEINCRNNLTGSLAVHCGVNFPVIQYRHLTTGTVERLDTLAFKEGVYWIDLTKDLMRFFTSRREEGYSLREYVTPYLGEKVFGILSLTDPLPFAKRCYHIGRLIVRTLAARFRGRSGPTAGPGARAPRSGLE